MCVYDMFPFNNQVQDKLPCPRWEMCFGPLLALPSLLWPLTSTRGFHCVFSPFGTDCTLSVNSGDGCDVMKIPVDHQFVKHRVARLATTTMPRSPYIFSILNFSNSTSPQLPAWKHWLAAMLLSSYFSWRATEYLILQEVVGKCTVYFVNWVILS